MPKRVVGAWNAKFHPGLSYLRTNVRMIFLEPKFLGCIDNQILLPMELHFAHARTTLWINCKTRTDNAPVSSFTVRSDRFPSLFIYFNYSEIPTLQKVPRSGGVSLYWSFNWEYQSSAFKLFPPASATILTLLGFLFKSRGPGKHH